MTTPLLLYTAGVLILALGAMRTYRKMCSSHVSPAIAGKWVSIEGYLIYQVQK